MAAGSIVQRMRSFFSRKSALTVPAISMMRAFLDDRPLLHKQKTVELVRRGKSRSARGHEKSFEVRPAAARNQTAGKIGVDLHVRALEKPAVLRRLAQDDRDGGRRQNLRVRRGGTSPGNRSRRVDFAGEKRGARASQRAARLGREPSRAFWQMGA